jgi:hypothetical protein
MSIKDPNPNITATSMRLRVLPLLGCGHTDRVDSQPAGHPVLQFDEPGSGPGGGVPFDVHGRGR